jgi:hypothetical protein
MGSEFIASWRDCPPPQKHQPNDAIFYEFTSSKEARYITVDWRLLIASELFLATLVTKVSLPKSRIIFNFSTIGEY